MKTLALAVLVACAAATSAADTKETKPAAAPQDVVEAAKSAKAKRKQSTSKVITNADVKKSKGKVVETTARKPVDAEPEPSLVEQQQAMRKARTAYDAKSAAAQAEVEQLEKELAALEQQYYEENDLDRRDGELVRRFDVTKKKLDAARAVLAELTPQ
jgi:hypothetical protein